MTKKISTRGRGCKRGPVRIKVARVIPEQEAVLRNRGINGGLYEDVMLYVKDQNVTTRKRGRPKKVLEQVGISRTVNNTTEVIYVPSSLKQGSRQYVPIVTSVHRSAVRGHVQNSQINRQNVQGTVTRGIIQTTTVLPSSKPILPVEPLQTKQEENKINWPKDLLGLVATWDKLPETQTRGIVKWLLAPLNTKTLPSSVINAHGLINELDDTLDGQIHCMEQLIHEMETPKTVTPPIPPPKVVVQAEPTLLQEGGQWSSMADKF